MKYTLQNLEDILKRLRVPLSSEVSEKFEAEVDFYEDPQKEI
jgi:hypothetical protein